MAIENRLRARRIAVLAADGFEKVELTVPVTAMRAAGAEVDIVSLRPGRIRGVNLHEPASRVTVDRTLPDVSVDDYDALLIPGGFINPDLLRQSAEARAFVRKFDASGKPIATLCHGPWLLASAGLTAGRRMTSWPGVRDDMVNAGATWLDESVVHDHNWLTSRGPQDMVPFLRALLPLFRRTSAAASTDRYARGARCLLAAARRAPASGAERHEVAAPTVFSHARDGRHTGCVLHGAPPSQRLARGWTAERGPKPPGPAGMKLRAQLLCRTITS